MFKLKTLIMANVKFYLKTKKSPKGTQTNINLHFYFNYYEIDQSGEKKYKFLKYFTGEKINSTFWNSEKQRAKETKKFPEYPEFNTRLNDIESTINDIYRTLVNDNIAPTPELLKEKLLLHYNKITKPTIQPEQETLFSFIKKFIDESKTLKKTSTISVYHTTLKHLRNYAEINKLKILDFEHITLDFYYSFTDYLINDLLLSGNAMGKYIKTLKTFLNEATERNINTNLAFKSKKFKTINEQTEQIYLTDTELNKIYNLDLSENKRLDKIRDLFIIGCYTALRFSDFSQIEPENIIKNGTQLKVKTIKTGETVVIPLHYRIKEILKKYDNQTPPAISNQKMNEYIKEVGKLAKINDIVIKTEKKGSLRIDKKIKKYNLITTHTARRSGATNMFLADMKPIEIMKITGHKTEKAFMRYIRISPEKNADLLMNNKFFNAPLKVAQ
ncbi:MAG: site-specific integrase [Bacteroidetes bacterium]|nr:MAG: site-specific integrase [Bacteroidota bacterium]